MSDIWAKGALTGQYQERDHQALAVARVDRKGRRERRIDNAREGDLQGVGQVGLGMRRAQAEFDDFRVVNSAVPGDMNGDGLTNLGDVEPSFQVGEGRL